MRSILVLGDRGASMDARLKTALSLARASGGHVTVLIDTPVARYVALDPLGGGYVATEAMQEALAGDDEHARQIDARLAAQDVPFDVIRSEAEPVVALAAAARLADLVVVSRTGRIVGELALTARTPILVVRDDQRLDLPVGRACVAWDGSDEAAAALRGAAPLLRDCASVTVVTVTEKDRGRPTDDAMRYLSRHGVKAELQAVARVGSIEETIAAAAARAQADLLVMGAFGHSRMREYLFGGVTRYFVEEATGPALLLAH